MDLFLNLWSYFNGLQTPNKSTEKAAFPSITKNTTASVGEAHFMQQKHLQ